MSSKKGRWKEPWMPTKEGRFCKTMLDLCGHEYRRLVGTKKGLATVAHYERLVPYHQTFWKRPRTFMSMWSRRINCNKKNSKEKPSIHPKLQPYLPLAHELIERDEPWSKEELLQKLQEIEDRKTIPAPEKKKSSRKTISVADMREAARTVSESGEYCPCCKEVKVAEGDERINPGEFDHYYANQWATADHIWLICSTCHDNITHGRVNRRLTNALFEAYQTRREQLATKEKELHDQHHGPAPLAPPLRPG